MERERTLILNRKYFDENLELRKQLEKYAKKEKERQKNEKEARGQLKLHKEAAVSDYWIELFWH